MKKVLFVFMGVALMSLASCKKSGVCDCGTTGTITYNDMDKDEYEDVKDNCSTIGCQWSDN